MQDALALSLVVFRDNGKSGDRIGDLEAENAIWTKALVMQWVPLEKCPGILILLQGFRV